MKGEIVRDFRTLNALEHAGYVILRGSSRATERHWTGLQVRVITVKEGPKLNHWWDSFTHRGNEYRISYFDGCFHPFVVRISSQKELPHFV